MTTCARTAASEDDPIPSYWLERGVLRPEGRGGRLAGREYVNLDSGSRVVVLPTVGSWETARDGSGRYQAWVIPPDGSPATAWRVPGADAGRRGEGMDFSGSNAASAHARAFTTACEAVERVLSIATTDPNSPA